MELFSYIVGVRHIEAGTQFGIETIHILYIYMYFYVLFNHLYPVNILPRAKHVQKTAHAAQGVQRGVAISVIPQ